MLENNEKRLSTGDEDGKLNPSTSNFTDASPGGTFRGSRANADAINKFYIFGHCSCLAIGMFSFGVCIGQFNPVSVVYKYLEDWDEDTYTFNIALITSCANLGAMIGAFTAPVVIERGKKKIMILTNVFLILVYAMISFTPISVPLQCVGKLLQGIGAGMFSVLSPSFINDMAPVELLGPIGGLNQAGVTLGILVPTLMAWGIPG